MSGSKLALPLLLAATLCGCSSEETVVDPVAACDVGDSYAAIVSSLNFTREDPVGVTPGFNLDGVVSDARDDASCNQPDTVDPSGVKGIDNQVARLVPTVEKVYGNAIDGLVQGAINNGELEILLEMDGVSSFADDDCVNLSVGIGKGSVILGTDGVLAGYQTFDLDPKHTPSQFLRGSIANGVMTAGPFEVALPLKLFDVQFTLHLHGGMFRFQIDDQGNIDGILGGGIDVQELLDGVKQGAGVANSIGLVELVLKGAADMARDKSGVCHQISAALSFKAVPAFIRK